MQIGGWEVIPDRSRERPETILEQGPECLTLATIDYRLRLARAVVLNWFGLTSDGSAEGLDPAFINVADRNGWTALIRADFVGLDELCRRLLDTWGNPNRSNMSGTTPLMYAASSRDVEGGQRASIPLLQHGANPDQVDRFGRDLMSYHPTAMTRLKGMLR